MTGDVSACETEQELIPSVFSDFCVAILKGMDSNNFSIIHMYIAEELKKISQLYKISCKVKVKSLYTLCSC